MLSNVFMPPAYSNTDCIRVRITYSSHIFRADPVKVNDVLLCVGPVVSATYKSRPSMPRLGSTAIKSIIIPTPPNQCVSDLQKKSGMGNRFYIGDD